MANEEQKVARKIRKAAKKSAAKAAVAPKKSTPGKGKTKGTKGNKGKDKGYSKVKAPAAVAVEMHGGKCHPKVRYLSTGDLEVEHSEIIQEVFGTGSFTVKSAFLMNAGNQFLHPWLANMSRNFERFRYKELDVSFLPASGTEKDGAIWLTYDYDSSDTSAPSSVLEVAQNVSYQQVVPWRNATVRIKCDNKDASTTSFIVKSGNSLSVDTGAELLSDMGKFYMCTEGMNDVTGIGWLKVHYKCILQRPKQPSDAALTAFNTEPQEILTTAPTRLYMAPSSSNSSPLEGYQHTGTLIIEPASTVQVFSYIAMPKIEITTWWLFQLSMSLTAPNLSNTTVQIKVVDVNTSPATITTVANSVVVGTAGPVQYNFSGFFSAVKSKRYAVYVEVTRTSTVTTVNSVYLTGFGDNTDLESRSKTRYVRVDNVPRSLVGGTVLRGPEQAARIVADAEAGVSMTVYEDDEKQPGDDPVLKASKLVDLVSKLNARLDAQDRRMRAMLSTPLPNTPRSEHDCVIVPSMLSNPPSSGKEEFIKNGQAKNPGPPKVAPRDAEEPGKSASVPWATCQFCKQSPCDHLGRDCPEKWRFCKSNVVFQKTCPCCPNGLAAVCECGDVHVVYKNSDGVDVVYRQKIHKFKQFNSTEQGLTNHLKRKMKFCAVGPEPTEDVVEYL